MYKIFSIILSIVLIISTILICVFKPDMHKSILVYNSQYKIEPVSSNVEIQNQSSRITQKSLPEQTAIPITLQKSEVKEQPLNTAQIPVKMNTKPVISFNKTAGKNIDTKIRTQEVKNIPPQIDVNKIVANNQKILKNQNTEAKTVQMSQQKIHSTPSNNPIQSTKNIVNTQPVKTVPQKVVSAQPVKTAPKPVVITPAQEEIAWNIWRSNLQNKIMHDTKLPPVPMGTIFRFSFDVDKFGRITNIQTWSDTSQYTPYAIQFVAPVIRNCQGRSILTFPEGTSRTSTKFVGAWKISTSSKYSTPQDYNDIEKVVK